MTKLNYIHMNPVKAGVVLKEEEYLNSSCCDYSKTRAGPIILAKQRLGLKIHII